MGQARGNLNIKPRNIKINKINKIPKITQEKMEAAFRKRIQIFMPLTILLKTMIPI
jgi:hypothetical protein